MLGTRHACLQLLTTKRNELFRGSKKILAGIAGYFAQLYDAVYWSITILLGSVDKAPTTNGGRILGDKSLIPAPYL